MTSHADGMHRRLIELASSSGASFSIVVGPADVNDAVTLADVQGWVFADTQVHASGLLLRFVRSGASEQR